MKKLRSIGTVILVILIACVSCKDQPNANDIDPNSQQAIDLAVETNAGNYVTDGRIIGLAVGVYKNGKFSYYGYGETADGSGIVPDENTVFEINSLCKAMTSIMLVNELQKQNKSIDDPVNNFLPFAIKSNGTQPLLVKHLLNHTSGLPELPSDISGGWSNMAALEAYDSADLFTFLKSRTFPAPGNSFIYSNTSFALAGIILERITGNTYEENLVQAFAEPLGMTNTTIGIAEGVVHAKGYNAQKQEIAFVDKVDALKSSACVRSTVSDMMIYARHHLELDSSPLKAAMETCMMTSHNAPKVGLDWFYSTINGYEVLMHFGGIASFNSAIYICREKQTALVLMNNTDLGGNGSAFESMANNLAGAIIK